MLANILLGFSIAFLPLFIRITNIDFIRESKDFLFITIAFIVITSLGNVKRKLTLPLILASIYIVIMITFNQHKPNSSNVVTHTMEISAGWFLFIKYFMSYDRKSIQCLLDGMIIGSVIQSILALSGYFGFEMYATILKIFCNLKIKSTGSGISNMVGSFGNNNLTASYLCLCIPAYFSRKNIKYLSILPIGTLLLTQSWMGIASFVAGVFYYLNLRYQVISKAKVYLLAIVGMIIIPFFNIGIDSGRFEVWRRIIGSASIKNWTIGMGPGWFPDWKMTMGEVRSYTPILQEHNSYLTIFNTFGLIGIFILISIFYRYSKQRDVNSILSVIFFTAFCNSWGHFTVQQSTVMIIIIPVAALCLGENYVQCDKENI